MRPLRTRLQMAAQRTGLRSDVTVRDYLLSWVLAGISRVSELGDSLVFKGGTALNKCYFGDYRFSEDLDFSGLEDTPTGAEMDELIGEVCEVAVSLLEEYDPVEISFRRYTERRPHPGGQQAFDIYPVLSWQRQPSTRVRVEITMDEPVIQRVERRPVLHDYGEALDADIQVYALEEIVAEKLRAILQQTRRLDEGTWFRSRARDYYDIWRILQEFRDEMDLTDFRSMLDRKCDVRDVSCAGPDDFFADDIVSDVVARWEDSLGPLVPELPGIRTVIPDLRRILAKML